MVAAAEETEGEALVAEVEEEEGGEEVSAEDRRHPEDPLELQVNMVRCELAKLFVGAEGFHPGGSHHGPLRLTCIRHCAWQNVLLIQ